MKEALSRAQSLFKRRNYRLALDILESNTTSSALKKLRIEDQLVALDLLASLWEKQGFNSKARYYAAHMIRVNEHDIRGYLRLGKILQLIPEMGADAVGVYQRALQRVRPMPQQYQEFLERQLQNAREKAGLDLSSDNLADMRNSLSPRRDFVHVLPIELINLIFSQTSFRDRVRCCLVSRSWRDYMYSQPHFWATIQLEVNNSKPTLQKVAADIILKYCNRSIIAANLAENRKIPLHLDLQSVTVERPNVVLESIITSTANASRLKVIKVNPERQGYDHLLIRTLRKPPSIPKVISNPLPLLTELRICSDSPQRDIRWCLMNLPSLELLDIVITSERTAAPAADTAKFLEPVACTNLHTLSLLNRNNSEALTVFFVCELTKIPSLQRIDIHHVVSKIWPTMHMAMANKRLTRFGFSSANVLGSEVMSPLPRFSGDLERITLNDMRLDTDVPYILMNGERWTEYAYISGAESTQNLSYLEIKRVTLTGMSLSDLIRYWGCCRSLETLVIKSFNFPETSIMTQTTGRAQYDLFQFCPNLTTLQFTGMGTMTEYKLEWILRAAKNVRKLNMDHTAITGPQLVRLLRELPNLRVIRCNNTIEVSSETTLWANSLPINVIWNDSRRK